MRAVPRTPELSRILSLPRRSGAGYDDLIDPLSELLKKPGHVCRPLNPKDPNDRGCAGGFTRLNVFQTQGLCEFHDHGGTFIQGPLGVGKTGIAVLAPTLLEPLFPEGIRALYVLPGSGVGKTIHEINILREHWHIIPFQLVSYQKLAREEQEFFFFEPPGPYNVIILDEAHYCRNAETAVTRRINRLRDKAGQEIEVVRISTGQTFRVRVPPPPRMATMTATPIKDSVRDVGHVMGWSMGERSPLPLDDSDLADWSGALDAEPAERLAPGALTAFSKGNDSLEMIRKGVGAWIFDTPGCISSTDTYVDAKLDIALRNVKLAKVEDDWFKVLRGDPTDIDNFPGKTTPDGDVFTEAAELWRHACSLALGYFTKWDPPAPPEWRMKRGRWHVWAREILAESRTLDTLAQLATAVDTGRFDRARAILCGGEPKTPRQVLEDWREIQPTFVPNSVPVWVGETSLKYAETWLEGGGIVWTGHRHFGIELAKRTGCPYFSADGLDEYRRQSIVTSQAKAIIASSVACAAQFNLQRYHRNLIASVWPAAYQVEQLIGRTHRQGQRAPLVTVEWMISCREQLEGFARAASCQAPMMRDLMRVPSRLCGARVQTDPITTSGWAFAEQEE